MSQDAGPEDPEELERWIAEACDPSRFQSRGPTTTDGETRSCRKRKLEESQEQGDCEVSDIQRVVEKVCRELNEDNTDLVSRVCRYIGAEMSIELLDNTLLAEEVGGEMTAAGKRRTAGGVFFAAAKDIMGKEEMNSLVKLNRPFKQALLRKRRKRQKQRRDP